METEIIPGWRMYPKSAYSIAHRWAIFLHILTCPDDEVEGVLDEIVEIDRLYRRAN
jgi:hypothetical protein